MREKYKKDEPVLRKLDFNRLKESSQEPRRILSINTIYSNTKI